MAPIARSAGISVLAFTNDATQAQPGVWTLGITPAQQVRRLVAAASGQGRSQFAAMLPDTDFGHAMGQALEQGTAASGLPPPTVRFYGRGMAAINAAAIATGSPWPVPPTPMTMNTTSRPSRNTPFNARTKPTQSVRVALSCETVCW